MTDLPASNIFTTVTTTNGVAKQAQDDLLEFVREAVGGAPIAELTINNTGDITPTSGLHTVDTFSDAATDDLENIITTNLATGKLLLIRAESAARTVVVKHQAGGAGQINLAAGIDLSLTEIDQWLLLFRDGSDWTEIGQFRQDLLSPVNVNSTGSAALVNVKSNVNSGAVAQVLGFGHDSGGNDTVYGQMVFRAETATDLSEDGIVALRTIRGGTEADRLLMGTGVYTAGVLSGDQGVGSINASAYYDDGIRHRPFFYESQVATTSGTTVELVTTPFISSSAVDIEIMFNEVSTNTSNQPPIVQVGYATGPTYETTGYDANICQLTASSNGTDQDTDGFYAARPTNYQLAETISGTIRLRRFTRTADLWIVEGNTITTGTAEMYVMAGTITSTEEVDRIRLTTPGGTATFDNGAVRCRWR